MEEGAASPGQTSRWTQLVPGRKKPSSAGGLFYPRSLCWWPILQTWGPRTRAGANSPGAVLKCPTLPTFLSSGWSRSDCGALKAGVAPHCCYLPWPAHARHGAHTQKVPVHEGICGPQRPAMQASES